MKKVIKNVRVVFYLDKQNKDLLFNHCELLQIKPSFFVRNIVMEKLGKPIFETPKSNLETKQYTGELLRIGVNLNQIARKLNSGAKFMIADQRKVLDEMESLKNHIIEIKSKL